MEVDAGVNPDAHGRPSPVVVRLYELKALAAFRSSDFFSLFDHDQQTLGVELVTKEEYLLEPGYKRQFDRKLQPDTRFIGVIAAFRDLERSQWRATMTVVQQETTPVFIRIEANKVSVRFQ